MAKAIGRTTSSVKHRAAKLRVTKARPTRKEEYNENKN